MKTLEKNNAIPVNEEQFAALQIAALEDIKHADIQYRGTVSFSKLAREIAEEAGYSLGDHQLLTLVWTEGSPPYLRLIA